MSLLPPLPPPPQLYKGYRRGTGGAQKENRRGKEWVQKGYRVTATTATTTTALKRIRKGYRRGTGGVQAGYRRGTERAQTRSRKGTGEGEGKNKEIEEKEEEEKEVKTIWLSTNWAVPLKFVRHVYARKAFCKMKEMAGYVGDIVFVYSSDVTLKGRCRTDEGPMCGRYGVDVGPMWGDERPM